MVNRLPYIVDLEAISAMDMTFEDWLQENEILVDELILEACEELNSSPLIETLPMIEVHIDLEAAIMVEMDRGAMEEALNIAREKWASREDFSRAIRARDLLKKIQDDK